LQSRGRIVCNCLNVSEAEINAALDGMQGAPEVVLASLQQNLKCGASCGSCAPEVKRMVWARKGVLGMAA
jgi:assimilatory nitrate reductase catalytic subunit